MPFDSAARIVAQMCLQISRWSAKYGQVHEPESTSSDRCSRTVYASEPITVPSMMPPCEVNLATAPDRKYDSPLVRDREETEETKTCESRMCGGAPPGASFGPTGACDPQTRGGRAILAIAGGHRESNRAIDGTDGEPTTCGASAGRLEVRGHGFCNCGQSSFA